MSIAINTPENISQLQELLKDTAQSNTQVILKENLAIHRETSESKPKLAVDLGNLNRIIDLDRENFTVTVEAGINYSAFQEQLAQEGFFFPLDNLIGQSTSLSYNVVHGTPSLSQGKYGTFREYVVGLEAVLHNGTHIKLGGKNIKNVSGYDLMGLMVGSQELLGVITQLTLRLLPLPEAKWVVITPFDSFSQAVVAAAQTVSAGSAPAKLQVYSNQLTSSLSWGLPPKTALVWAEFDGFKPSLGRQVNTYKEVLHQHTQHSSKDWQDNIFIKQGLLDLSELLGPLMLDTQNLLKFSSFLSKVAILAKDLDQLTTGNQPLSSGIMVDPQTGFGLVTSSDLKKSDWDGLAPSMVKTIEQHKGLVLSNTTFAHEEVNIIFKRLLAICSQASNSPYGLTAEGGK